MNLTLNLITTILQLEDGDNLRLYQQEAMWSYSSDTKKTMRKEQLGHNISYPSSAAAVVFGVYLSARAAFRLDRKSPAIRPCV